MIFDWLVVIGAALAGLGTLVYWVHEAFDAGEFIPIILGVFLGAIAAVGTGLVLLLIDWGLSSLTHPETIYKNVSLANLQDSTQTSGSFFLGIGSLNGTPTYGFYTEKNGAYQFNTVDATGINVYQDTKKPYAVQNADCKMRSWHWLLDCVDWSADDYVAFHVPKGTVKVNYNLDAKN